MKRRKPRLVRPEPRQQEADMRDRPADFSDPESERVIDAMADALLGPAVLRKANDDFDAWVARQQVRR